MAEPKQKPLKNVALKISRAIGYTTLFVGSLVLAEGIISLPLKAQTNQVQPQSPNSSPSGEKPMAKKPLINIDSILIGGMQKFSAGDFEGAIVDFDKALEHNHPDSIFILMAKAAALARLERYSDALNAAAQAIEKGSAKEKTLAYHLCARIYNLLGEGEKALEAIDSAIFLNPKEPESDFYHNDAEFHRLRGFAYLNMEEYEKAIENFSGYLSKFPNDNPGSSGLNQEFGLAYKARAECYARSGKFREAIEDLGKIIEVSPLPDREVVFDAYFERGRLYLELGKFAAAIEDFDKASLIDGSIAELYSMRGAAYYSLGMYLKAAEDLSKGISMGSKKSIFFLNRSDAYEKTGEHEKAEADRKKAQEIKSQGK